MSDRSLPGDKPLDPVEREIWEALAASLAADGTGTGTGALDDAGTPGTAGHPDLGLGDGGGLPGSLIPILDLNAGRPRADQAPLDVPAELSSSGSSRDSDAPYAWLDEHFVPPEPEPLPRTDLRGALAWAGAVGGPAVFVVTTVAGRPPGPYLSFALMLAFLLGAGSLIWRLPPDGDDDPFDDGARV